MQKLVMVYDNSDGWTYSYERTLPIIYESAEALLCDFMDVVRKSYEESVDEFFFCGETFETRAFKGIGPLDEKLYEIAPEIFTIDEWFFVTAIRQ